MEKNNLNLVFTLSVLVLSVLSFFGVMMITQDVIGSGNNGTTYSKVFVWNTEPNITSMLITPSSINLIPGNTTEVNCTAYVWDYNGWADVNITNATFYHSSVASDSADDNNNHYTANVTQGGDCNCTEAGSTNASCRCSFDLWYYANNGSWTCNMSIEDNSGNATERYFYFNDSDTVNVTVNVVIAINTPEELDYGNLSVTEVSGEKELNISNYGNAPINISVRGFGGTDVSADSNPYNNSMQCDFGNISLDLQRYSKFNDTVFSLMTNLSNSTTQMNLSLPVRTDDAQFGDDTNSTYWKLEVPLTVGGNCNGTLLFTALQA